MGLFAKWQNLSTTLEQASSIINLIWTDLAAGAVVGTKGTLGPNNVGMGNQIAGIQIDPTVRRIKYHWLFAIPAFLLAGMVVIITVIALIFMVLKHSNLETMRRHLFQTSAGRIYTAFLFPEYCDLQTRPVEWSRGVGTQMIDLNEESEPVQRIAVRMMEKQRILPYEGT